MIVKCWFCGWQHDFGVSDDVKVVVCKSCMKKIDDDAKQHWYKLVGTTVPVRSGAVNNNVLVLERSAVDVKSSEIDTSLFAKSHGIANIDMPLIRR